MARDMNGRLVLRNHLLAFRVVEGKHDGKNLGRIIFEILKEAVLLEKVSACRCISSPNPDTVVTLDRRVHVGQCLKLRHSDGGP